jgi:hypothetical protein
MPRFLVVLMLLMLEQQRLFQELQVFSHGLNFVLDVVLMLLLLFLQRLELLLLLLFLLQGLELLRRLLLFELQGLAWRNAVSVARPLASFCASRCLGVSCPASNWHMLLMLRLTVNCSTDWSPLARPLT